MIELNRAVISLVVHRSPLPLRVPSYISCWEPASNLMTTRSTPSRKSSRELAHWEAFTAVIDNCETGEQLLAATLQYEQTERRQASYAFNRAKKIMHRVGLLKGEEWRLNSYRSLGGLRFEFYEVLANITEPSTILILKRALCTPKASTRNRSILYGPMEVDELSRSTSCDHSAHSGLPSDDSKARKRALSALKEVVPTGVDDARPLSVIENELLQLTKQNMVEYAMAHPAFQLLSHSQQKQIRDNWVALLLQR